MSLHNNVAIVVTFGGIRQIFYGGDGVYTPEDTSRVAINCISVKETGSFREEMPRFGGIAKPSGLRLTLEDRGGQLGELLSKTLAGVTASALLSTVPAEEDTETITCRQSINGFDASGYGYIGHETFAYSAKSNANKSFTITERGAFGSVIHEHEVNSEPDKSYNPLVTSGAVAWKGRKAVVTLHEIKGNRVIDPNGFELVRGFLASEPEPMPGGAWSITVVQELAKFDNQIADAGFATSLVNGWHYFAGHLASSVRLNEVIPERSLLNGGLCQVIGAVNEGDTTVNFGANAQGVWAIMSQAFPDSPNDLDLIASWDADGIPPLERCLIVITDLTPPGAPAGTVSTTPLHGDIPAGALVYNKERKSTMTCRSVPNGLQEWPKCIVTEFNDFFHDGWAPVVFDAQLSADAQTLTVGGLHISSPLTAPYLEWDWAVLTGQGWELTEANPENCWFPIFRNIDQQRAAGRINAVDVVPNVGDVGGADLAQYRVPPPALSFWQRERYILVRDNIFVAATEANPGSIRVRDAGGVEQVFKYIGVDVASDGNGNTVGYIIELAPEAYETENFAPFGNWQGQPEVVIEPYVAFVEEDPRVLALKIMLSGYGGNVFPSEYSTLPRNFGLAIDPDAVDVEGILAFPVPPPLRKLNFRAGKPTSARELLDPILQGIGAAVVMRNIGGTRKITFVKTRTVHNLFSSGVIGNGDWLPGNRPGSGKLDDVINVFRIHCNYDAEKDAFGVQVNFFDRDSIDFVRVTADVTLKVRGLEVAPGGAVNGLLGPRSALTSIYKMLRDQGSLPIRQFNGGIGWSVAKNLSVGSVATVTINEGRKLDGTQGIDNQAMLVTAIETNPVTKQSIVELIYQGRDYTGFAPVCQVAEVISANKVRFTDNAYTDLNDSVTGLPVKDWYYFAVNGQVPDGGIPVRCVHTGNESANTDKTLTALALTTGIATIANHGLSVGDRVRPRNWASAASFHKVFCFLSEAGFFSDSARGFLYS